MLPYTEHLILNKPAKFLKLSSIDKICKLLRKKKDGDFEFELQSFAKAMKINFLFLNKK